MKNTHITLSIIIGLCVGQLAFAAQTTAEISPHGLGERSIYSERATATRLEPTAKVCVQGEECGVIQVAAASGPRSGEDVYNSNCAGCHASGVMGAPKTGDKATWSAREKAQGGLDGLVATAKAGVNAMPPMGTCMDCSDAELKSAIEYMMQ